MLQELHLKHVGPAPELDVELGERLNLFTGDNGLGKTFLLDIAWWALTGTWVGEPAWPRREPDVEPEIRFRTVGQTENTSRETTSRFLSTRQKWSSRFTFEPQELVIYARVDGSYSVWDPARCVIWENDPVVLPRPSVKEDPENASGLLVTPTPAQFVMKRQAYLFSSQEIWDGLNRGGTVVTNGLIRDWMTWQNQPQRDAFEHLIRVLQVLSHPDEPMLPGPATRVSIQDPRDIPTLELPYGNVPVTLASAGMRRILGLAYLTVWTWYEHLRAVELLNQAPARRLVLLVDEIECHLHPRWQRAILPALLSVAGCLEAEMETQLLVTTHAPLILASAEPYFDEARDRLFLFELRNQKVRLEDMPWSKQGDIVSWLTSDVFDLQQARSREAEAAVEAAEAFMRGEFSRLPANLHSQPEIHKALLQLLPGHDPFWPRWIVECGTANGKS